MKLYRKFLALHLKNELEYKGSFIMGFISQSFVFFSSFFAIYALFEKFNVIKNYSVYQILLVYAVIQFGFSINVVFNRGFDHFDRLIKNGEFDRFLTRPRSLFLQVMGSEIDYSRTTRIIQSLIILFIAIYKIDVIWTLDKIITLIFMMISSIILFFNIYLIGAALCFVTVEGLEIINVLTYGGREMGQYPMDIYKKGFRVFFTYIIPFSIINYYPLMYILGNSSNKLFIFIPLLNLLYIPVCVFIFNKGLKRYGSTGS